MHAAGDGTTLGVQPALDGIRAVSVIAVLCYHAGFGWSHGGFLGVEVFFVVSGFLITTLLIEERNRCGAVSLRRFWARRARRLLPALFAMLVAVTIVVLWRGDPAQQSQLRRDLPWGVGYVANWGQILSDAPYFAPSPSALRQLWSLAVEEQWYLLWPLVFVALGRRAESDRRRGVGIAIVAIAIAVGTTFAATIEWPQRWLDPWRGDLREVDTVNFLYLSTFTRSGGLLLGAALAFLWRPWARVAAPAPISTARRSAPLRSSSRRLDAVGALALVGLVGAFAVGDVEDVATYQWLLPLTGVASLAVIGVAVHPNATIMRRFLGQRWIVAVGRRSYGLYLWSWPISLAVGANRGSWTRSAIAMAITAPVSEACYRWIEGPIRSGVAGRWWSRLPSASGQRFGAVVAAAVVAIGAFGVIRLAEVDPVYDAAKDTASTEVFDLIAPPTAEPITSAEAPSSATTTVEALSDADGLTEAAAAATTNPTTKQTTTTAPPPPVTFPPLPRRLVIVGDSTAHSLAVNLPRGLDTYFRVEDGSINGCSVYSDGVGFSGRSFRRPFGDCAGWERRWLKDAQRVDAELALVVLGAWDVLDVQLGDSVIAFATTEFDDRFSSGVQRGIDVLAAEGLHVALLEVPCMRPREARGAGTPPLPERADDTRVSHLNQLLRNVAARNPRTTTFIDGPPEFCNDETIASDKTYRWDGVHASGKGVNLVFDAIALQLLSIELPADLR